MFNFLKKKTGANNSQSMGMLQRLAMKKLEKMTPEEQMKLAQKFLTPENIEKNKDKINSLMDQMKSSGQLSQEQIDLAKKKLGL